MDRLVVAHPLLFAGRPFEIPYPFVAVGWLAIANAMCTDVELILGDIAARFRPIEAKEKLGGWRFHWRLEPAADAVAQMTDEQLYRAASARVRQAQKETTATCMWCGEPGAPWTTGWVHVACDRHRRPNAVTLAKWLER